MLQEYSGKEGDFFPYLNFTPNPKRLGCFFVSLFFQSNFSPLLDSPHYNFSHTFLDTSSWCVGVPRYVFSDKAC